MVNAPSASLAAQTRSFDSGRVVSLSSEPTTVASQVPQVADAAPSGRSESWQAFAICATLLALSFVLHPDPRGYGTHQHLLLPPCFFRLLTHLPCPFCGMTTGFALMARGQVAAAARSNFMAPGAFALTVLIALLALWGLLTGRAWIPPVTRTNRFARLVLVVIAVFWVANIVNQVVLRK